MLIVPEIKSQKEATGLAQLLLGKGAQKSDAFNQMLQQLSSDESAPDAKELPSLLLQLQTHEDVVEPDARASLMQLLKGTLKSGKGVEQLPVHTLEDAQFIAAPVLKTLSVKELKSLIHDAKNYLREQIGQKAEAAQIKEMPKTIRGLLELAKKVGVNIEKVSMETLKEAPKARVSSSSVQEGETVPNDEMQKPSSQNKNESVKGVSVFDTSRLKREPQHTTAELVNTKTQSVVSNEADGEKKILQPLRSLLHGEPLRERQDSIKPDAIKPETLKAEAAGPETVKTDALRPESIKPEALKSEAAVVKAAAGVRTSEKTPLNETAGRITPQADNAGAVKSSESPKSETKSAVDVKVTQVTPQAQAAARGEAAQMTTPAKEGLFTVMAKEAVNKQASQGEAEVAEESAAQSDKRVEVRTDAKQASVLPAATEVKEGLELKVKEAQQLVRHFSAQIKEAVENYKPPFTRLKFQLNPVKLGEVDITMVQRGNNVHININSNTTAIATLMQNATELKTQLANNGLGNSTMQFNSGGGEQQRQQQSQSYAEQMQEYYEDDENFEMLSSMEIIVPRYV